MYKSTAQARAHGGHVTEGLADTPASRAPVIAVAHQRTVRQAHGVILTIHELSTVRRHVIEASADIIAHDSESNSPRRDPTAARAQRVSSVTERMTIIVIDRLRRHHTLAMHTG